MKRRQPACRVKLNPHAVWERLNRLNVTQNQLAAMAGKWVVVALLLVWLSGSPESLLGTAAVFAVETTFTVLAAALLLPWAEALIQRTALLRKELL